MLAGEGGLRTFVSVSPNGKRAEWFVVTEDRVNNGEGKARFSGVVYCRERKANNRAE